MSFELFENLSVALLEVGEDGCVGRANAAAVRLLDAIGSPGAILGRSLLELLGVEEAGADDLAALWQGRRDDLQLVITPPDTARLTAPLSARCQRVPASPPDAGYVLVELVSEAATGGHASTRMLDHLLADAPTPIYIKDLGGRFIYLNNESAKAVGAEHLPPGASAYEMLPEDTVKEFNDNDMTVARTGEVVTFVEHLPDAKGGEDRLFASIKFPIHDPGQGVIAVAGVSFEVTELMRERRELESSRALLQDVFRSSRLGVVVLRPTTNAGETEIVECNEAYLELTGRPRSEVIGADCETMVHPDDRQIRRWLLSEMAHDRFPLIEARYLRPDGSSVWCMAVSGTAAGMDGEALFVIQLLDITERREFERQLRYHADHDVLTGLLSRRRFTEILETEVNSPGAGETTALLLLDLDGFKDVNDAHGHSTGDELLSRLSAALTDVQRPADRLARLGGDEFSMLLPHTDAATALAIAQRLVEIVAERGFVSDHVGRSEVTASVGATVWGPSEDLDADALLAEADIAMYDAKDSGKNRAVMFDRNLARRQRIAQRSDRVARLRRAIANGGFVLHAQPMVSLIDPSAQVTRYELLVRRIGLNGQLRMPDEFLPDASRYGLISQIDDWVMREAVELIGRRHASGSQISVSVNLSVDTIADPKTSAKIEELLRESGVPPELLTFEFTEAGAISDLALARDLSMHLRSFGCRVALDDFGSAFATLKYLKHIEFDQLKIDGEFIRDLPRSLTDQVIVKGITDIASGFGVEIVAEYVEDQETVDVLRGFGVHYGQGYYLGRPQPLEP